MGVESALLGNPPLTPRDALIQQALRTYVTNFNGNPKFPFGSPRPKPSQSDLANESNAWRIEVSAVIFMLAVIIVTLGRFWYRWKRRVEMHFGWDDVLIIPAACIAIAYDGHILSSFVDGVCLGKHMWFCTYEDIERLYLTFTVGQTTFYFSVYCSKLSLLFFTKRLTRSSGSKTFRYTEYTLFFLLVGAGLVSFFGTCFQCRPVSVRWSLVTMGQTLKKDYKCLDNAKFQTAVRALHISTDLLLMIYPAFILRTLKMKMTKKIGVGLCFCFGIMCVMCSVIRNIIFGRKRLDYTYMAHDVYIWNMLDISSATIVASLPAYYPLFTTIYKGTRSALSLSSAHSRPSGSNPKTPGNGTAGTRSSGSRGIFGSKIFNSKRHSTRESHALSDVEGRYERSQENGAEGEGGPTAPKKQEPQLVKNVIRVRDRERGKIVELDDREVEAERRDDEAGSAA